MLGGFIVCVQLDEGKRNSVSYVLVGFDNVFILLIFLSACGINNPIDISVSRIPLIFFPATSSSSSVLSSSLST